MKYVYLKGKSNVGKTTVLENLINHFRQLGAKTISSIYSKSGWERATVLELNGVVIGVNKEGDIPEHITIRNKWFDGYSCDIIFGAMRTKGTIINEINKLKTYNDVYVICKMSSEEDCFRKVCDDAQLEVLLKIFSNII